MVTRWSVCRCHVWPMVGWGGGRCGRCGDGAVGSHRTRDEAIATFAMRYQRLPDPIS